jgi:hypothetical protein
MRSAVGRLVAGVALVACLVAMPASAVFANQGHPAGPAPQDHPVGPVIHECPPLCVPDLGPSDPHNPLLWEILAFARRELETHFP